jgi:hypothetical protein
MKRTDIVTGRAYAFAVWRGNHHRLGDDYGVERAVVLAVPAAPAPIKVRTTARDGSGRLTETEVEARRFLGFWTEHTAEKKRRKEHAAAARQEERDERARREAAVQLLPAYAPGIEFPWWAREIRDYGDYSGDVDTSELLAMLRSAYAAGQAAGPDAPEPKPLPLCTLCGAVVTDPTDTCHDTYQPADNEEGGIWGPHVTA